MKIFFDHQTFSNQNYGGISRYICELARGINDLTEHRAHLSILWSNNIHLREYKLSNLSYPFPSRHRFLLKSNQIFNKVDFKLGNYDIYHATYFDSFLVRSAKPAPVITTFYDMTYEIYNKRFTDLQDDKVIINQKRIMAEQADHIIAISESTKRDIINLLDVDPEKISVVYLASPYRSIKYLNTPRDVYAKPYILYVGNRSGYKNFTLFLKAVSLILKRYSIKLVCAGGGGFTSSEYSLINSLRLTELVQQKSVNDKSLPDLYNNAIAFVFPSLYEGFGIPILEAFSCSCPCVVSNVSSLPEVAGNAALYVDPEDMDSISSAVEKLILDSRLRAYLVKKGYEQLNLFSWDKTVIETLNVYSKLY